MESQKKQEANPKDASNNKVHIYKCIEHTINQKKT